MSLKAELETWAAALKAYDDKEYTKSLNLFDRIADTSKILCNVGLIYATVGEHELAVANFIAACSLDRHLAIGYFQTGVSNFLLRRYEVAYKDFEEALLHLRSNQFIDYDQLGLKFVLWRAEILFNKGLCQIYMGNGDLGMRDMDAAFRDKGIDEHDVIQDALAAKGVGYTVFSIPVGVLYRPSENKLKNVKTKDYMGKAKLISASEAKDAYTDFVGAKRLTEGLGPAGQRLDRQTAVPAPSAVVPQPPPRVASPTKPPVSAAPPSSEITSILRSTTISFAPSPEKGGNSRPNMAASPPRSRAGSAEDTSLIPSRSAPQPPPSVRPTPAGVPPVVRRSSSDSNPDDDVDRRRPSQTSTAPSSFRGPSQTQSQGRPPGLRQSPSQPQLRDAPANLPQRARSRSRGPTDVRAAAAPRDVQQQQQQLQQQRNRSRSRGPDVRNRGEEDMTRSRGGVTQFYEDYLPMYGTGTNHNNNTNEPQPLERSSSTIRKVAAWTNKTVIGASPDVPPSRAPSQAVRNGRAGTRQQPYTHGAAGSNGSFSMYDEDEEERSGGSFEPVSVSTFEQMKIRIKIHYKNDVRGMALTPQTSFDDFARMVVSKFGQEWEDVSLQFRDEDGGRISLKDEMDWDMAIEVARGSGDPLGKPEGKLEMWLTVE